MRRWLVIAITAGLVIAGGNADAKPHRGPAQLCMHDGHNATSVKALIKCFAPKIGVSVDTALYIAYRESRYNPHVCNSSDHCGVYQDAQPIWDYEVHNYVYGHTLGTLSRLNGRANVILNLRYVKHNGWGPWGG